MEPLEISCDNCKLDGTSACDDCVVPFLCAGELASSPELPGPSRPESGAVIFDAAEARAMKLLHSAGLVPSLRFRRRVG